MTCLLLTDSTNTEKNASQKIEKNPSNMVRIVLGKASEIRNTPSLKCCQSDNETRNMKSSPEFDDKTMPNPSIPSESLELLSKS